MGLQVVTLAVSKTISWTGTGCKSGVSLVTPLSVMLRVRCRRNRRCIGAADFNLVGSFVMLAVSDYRAELDKAANREIIAGQAAVCKSAGGYSMKPAAAFA